MWNSLADMQNETLDFVLGTDLASIRHKKECNRLVKAYIDKRIYSIQRVYRKEFNGDTRVDASRILTKSSMLDCKGALAKKVGREVRAISNNEDGISSGMAVRTKEGNYVLLKIDTCDSITIEKLLSVTVESMSSLMHEVSHINDYERMARNNIDEWFHTWSEARAWMISAYSFRKICLKDSSIELNCCKGLQRLMLDLDSILKHRELTTSEIGSVIGSIAGAVKLTSLSKIQGSVRGYYLTPEVLRMIDYINNLGILDNINKIEYMTTESLGSIMLGMKENR